MFNEDSRSPGQDLNCRSREYEVRTLPTRQRRLVGTKGTAIAPREALLSSKHWRLVSYPIIHLLQLRGREYVEFYLHTRYTPSWHGAVTNEQVTICHIYSNDYAGALIRPRMLLISSFPLVRDSHFVRCRK